MDIGIGYGAINAGLPTFFDPLVFSIGGQDAIDGLPSLSGYGLDVGIQGGFLEPLMRKANAAETAVATRINNMESQIVIADHL